MNKTWTRVYRVTFRNNGSSLRYSKESDLRVALFGNLNAKKKMDGEVSRTCLREAKNHGEKNAVYGLHYWIDIDNEWIITLRCI